MQRKKRKKHWKIVLASLLVVLATVVTITWLQDTPQAVEPVTVSIPARIEPNPYFENLLSEYETKIRELQASTKTPGVAIAVVRDTTVLYLRGIGLREVGKQDSVDEHSVFRLASVSKCFAPILTGLLVEEGVLSWDDKIIRYLPDFELKSRAHTDSLTIRHVLSHTTGLPYHTYTNLVEEGLELSQMLPLLKDVNLSGKPGQYYSYQNVAYSIIGEVIEAATGKTYHQMVVERIFKPLRMLDASMTYEEILVNQNVARPHLNWRKGWRTTSINNTYYNVGPAGGVNASISDMAQLMRALLGDDHTFIQKQTLDEIFSPVVKARSKNRNFRKWITRADAYYGMGWRVLNFDADTLYYHGGYVNGYRSEIALNRKDKIGICVLSNGPGTLVDNSVPIFFNLYFNKRDSIDAWDRERKVLLELQTPPR